MGFRIDRPKVAIPAIIIIVALVGTVIGASISAITAGDDPNDASASQSPNPSPVATPTLFGKDFVTRTETEADPADAKALVDEAIANVRNAERFRFTLGIGGTGQASLISGKMEGEVDLSTGNSDPPKMRGTLAINTGANQVFVDLVRVGDALYIKSGDEKAYKKESVSKQNEAESGIGGVSTIDPVLSILNLIVDLPAPAYGASSGGGSGYRLIEVRTATSGDRGSSTIEILIDDTKHLIRSVTVERRGLQSAVVLGDFGDRAIQIVPPSL